MAVLAPSLIRLRNEFDRRWPNRDRRTDGWLCGGNCGAGSQHYPDSKGMVHAIDVDMDGIDWQFVRDHIYKGGGVLWYFIAWRQIWSSTYGFRGRVYTGLNPHTDHMHFSIHLSYNAEQFSGGWGIAVPGSLDRIEATGPNVLSPLYPTGWDFRRATIGVAHDLNNTAINTQLSAGWINGITDRT